MAHSSTIPELENKKKRRNMRNYAMPIFHLGVGELFVTYTDKNTKSSAIFQFRNPYIPVFSFIWTVVAFEDEEQVCLFLEGTICFFPVFSYLFFLVALYFLTWSQALLRISLEENFKTTLQKRGHLFNTAARMELYESECSMS